MTTFYIFIIAVVLPSGEIQVKHTLVPKCPTQAEVSAVLQPMKDKGEIKAWGGTCTPLVDPKTKEM